MQNARQETFAWGESLTRSEKDAQVPWVLRRIVRWGIGQEAVGSNSWPRGQRLAAIDWEVPVACHFDNGQADWRRKGFVTASCGSKPAGAKWVPFAKSKAVGIGVMSSRYTCKQCGAEFTVKATSGTQMHCPNCRSTELRSASVYDPAASIDVSDSPICSDELTLAPDVDEEPSPIYREPLPSERSTSDTTSPAPSVGWSWDDELSSSEDYSLSAVSDHDPCPGCGEDLLKSVVVCMRCGYNRNLGHKMQTERGAAFNPMAISDADSISVEPWDAQTIIFGVGGVTLFLVGVIIYLISPVLFAVLAGLLAIAMMNIAYWWVVVIAFQDDLVQGLLVLFIGIYMVIYCVNNAEECKVPG